MTKTFGLPILIVVAILVVIAALGQPFYIVTERDQVVVTRLNRPVRVIVGSLREDFDGLKAKIVRSAQRDETTPDNIEIENLQVAQGAGLRMKMPFIDKVERFPDTLLEYDADPVNIVTRDKKQLNVDNFARWRIENPLLYRIRVRTEAAARARLDDIIYSVLREELGRNELIEIIRTTKDFDPGDIDAFDDLEESLMADAMEEILESGREEIMINVTKRCDEAARERYGIHIIDVRIKRAELPPENLNAVFGRMRAERERISKGYRSEGDKEGAIIRGNTDREVQVILAEAEAKAQRTRGEGDAEHLRLYGEAFSRNVDFYKFVQTLEVMKEATPPGSEMIVGLNSSIYQMLRPQN